MEDLTFKPSMGEPGINEKPEKKWKMRSSPSIAFSDRIKINLQIPKIFCSSYPTNPRENVRQRNFLTNFPVTSSPIRHQKQTSLNNCNTSSNLETSELEGNRSKMSGNVTLTNGHSTAVQNRVRFFKNADGKITKQPLSHKIRPSNQNIATPNVRKRSDKDKNNDDDLCDPTYPGYERNPLSSMPLSSSNDSVNRNDFCGTRKMECVNKMPNTQAAGNFSTEDTNFMRYIPDPSLDSTKVNDKNDRSRYLYAIRVENRCAYSNEIFGNGKNATQHEESIEKIQIPPQIIIDQSENEDGVDCSFSTCSRSCHSPPTSRVESLAKNIGLSESVTDEQCEELVKRALDSRSQSIFRAHTISSTEDETNQAVQVSHLQTPSKIIKGPVSVTVKSGEKVVLTANYVGTPPNTVTWMRGGTALANGGQYSIFTGDFVSELTIHKVTSDDSGKYIATIENLFGGDSCFASVAVLGFPKPPGGPPTASDFTPHSLALSWYGSVFDGGSVLTGYVVEMCKVPERLWQTAATCIDTSCIVDGLSLGQRYLFRVRARNKYGHSEPSRETQTICLDDYLSTPNEDHDELQSNSIMIQNFGEFMERYELKEEVGRGKFGKVYRCVDKWTGIPRAAKMIRCRRSKDRADVYREIEVMKKLRHPKLLSIAGAFESDKVIVMVTEFISGGELFQRVIMDDFVLTESDCILFLRQICDAVSYMHRCSVLHLDLKPENILCKTRTSHQIKIIDFGLSAFHHPDEKLCILFGTPEFVAPEVIAFEPVGPPSDMWSVGVICYVLLSGLSPFLGDSESETFANITRGEIDFDEDEFDSISEDAKGFIAAIVVKNPRRRLTASECLNHPWLKRAYWLQECLPLSTEKLKKFIIRRKWQKSGTAIRALRRFVTLSRSSAESIGESECSMPRTPASPTPTDTSEDSGIFHELNRFDFAK